jgi:hypothetical protein
MSSYNTNQQGNAMNMSYMFPVWLQYLLLTTFWASTIFYGIRFCVPTVLEREFGYSDRPDEIGHGYGMFCMGAPLAPLALQLFLPGAWWWVISLSIGGMLFLYRFIMNLIRQGRKYFDNNSRWWYDPGHTIAFWSLALNTQPITIHPGAYGWIIVGIKSAQLVYWAMLTCYIVKELSHDFRITLRKERSGIYLFFAVGTDSAHLVMSISMVYMIWFSAASWSTLAPTMCYAH